MYYSIKNISEMLKCDSETVRRWVRTGKLKATKVDLKFRIKEEDIIELLKERTTGIDLTGKNLKEIVELIKK